MKYCTICKGKFDDAVSFCPKDGEVLEDDPSSFVGTVLDGQYQIESLLGKGGMGAVYLARHILLGDRVAIKILPPEVRTNAEWLRRFRREGQAARRFRHANAVTVYDLRTASDGTIYMVMEYVEGHTLDAELKRRGRFTASEALEVLEPIMSVLNTAHAMGVVHRDLKPENIMIGKVQTNGEAPIKLLDLGIAKMREIAGVDSSGTTELTMAGQVLGTPYYMSPEQWGEISRDGNPEIDGRTDIYSLGLVAYQMISGQRAYSASTLHELRREHIGVKPPPLVEKIPDVPQGFSEAIDRAISKDRSDRQTTAGELSLQLRAGLGDAAGQAPSSRTYPDIPHAADSHSHTQGSPGGITSKSDVNAATIVTVDATPTSPPSVPRPVVQPPVLQPPVAQVESAAKLEPVHAAGVDLSSSVTRVRVAQAEVEPKKSRGKVLVLVGAVVLVLVLVVAVVGGYFALNGFKTETGGGSGSITGKGKTGTGTEVSSTEAPEIGRYWLEVLPNVLAEPQRVAKPEPLPSGGAFKFHFEFSGSGFLYIVGPGEKNKPTAFLTNEPAEISGLQSNDVSKGSDFSFPSGVEHWMELDKKPGTEDYTIVFSTDRLSAPAFLNSQATGKPLGETEQAEFQEFLTKYKTSEPPVEIDDKDPARPFVRVKVPQAKGSSAPVVFGIRIEHK
ncbi:MAG TPA: serine/threonine-protein kinase [Pyrinomonadaceae bacterium]|jgi:serine/threonine-protein kinase|nr:serine/threonine-protein kinase [Pyrinomonadaceae bacterium]